MKNSSHLTRPVWGWALYDFANSAFATCVMSVIFSVYFARVLVPAEGIRLFGTMVPGESLWSYLISSVMFCVIILSPLLGALADQKALKRRFLILWATIGALSTIGLTSAVPSRLVLTSICVFFAVLGFEMSLVFYNAFLKDITDDATSGRVSGLGFALGYIGGGLCLAINLLLINRPSLIGIPPGNEPLAIRVGMGVVGIWWLLFSIPVFLWVKDKPPVFRERKNVIASLKQTFQDILQHPSLRRFIFAYLIYQDGIETVLLMASIFGAKALGMNTGQLALCYLLIQFVAFVGAMICGRLADAWSHKKVVLSALVIYAGVIVWAVLMKSQREFWALGVIVGLIMGGSQSASRSLFSRMIPAERASEFFSLFSIVGKAAGVVGPFVFGITTQFYGLRAGVGSMLFFFIVGGLILKGVIESPDS